MKVILLCLLIPLLARSDEKQTTANAQPQVKNEKGPKWDRKTPIDENTKYADYPYDLRMLIDNIDKGDMTYRNKQLSPQSRCRGLITVNRNIVPLMIAYNMGKTFKIPGPNQEVAEVKVQTGFRVSRINSIWRQNIRCLLGKSVTLLNSKIPRPVVPLFYK